MPSLPAVFVELRATATDFMAKMKSAQDELKKTADVAQSNMDRMANVGKVAFAGIAAAAVGFGALSVKAALDGEQAHAALVNAVQNSGTAFDAVGGKVEEMSGKFANLGYQNDEVEAALARLVQGTGSMSTAMRNMGLAADIAKARHMDLSEAAGSLGKILSGNMRPMAQMGLSAKDAAGNALSAADAIRLLNERFGGAAQAQAGTYAGQLDALHAKFQNLQEKVGNQLLPVLARMGDMVAGTVGFIERNGQAALVMAGIIGGPLVIAMNAFIAKQAVAFALSTVETVKKIGTAIMTVLVPATETEAAALTTAATAEAFLTAGLSVVAGAAAIAGVAFLSHASANADVASSAGDAKGAVDGLTGGEGDLGAVTATTTSALQNQADLFKSLNGDLDAQQSEVLKLIGDQQNLDRATKTLAGDTTAHAQAQQTSTKATRELGDAQTKLNKVTADYNKLQGGLGMEISLDQNHAHHDLEQAQLSHETAQTKLSEAVAQYGKNSVEARQASLDLESATFTLQSAQDAMGNVGQAAWDKVNAAQDTMNQAQQDVIDKTNAQKDALDKLNKPASDIAANTTAWQQAQHTLNEDWDKFNKLIEDHPEIRDQLVGQVKLMKENLPKGADTKPLNDMLTMLSQPLPPKSLAAVFLEPAPANSGAAQLAMLIAPPGVTNPALTGGGLLGILGSAGPAAPAGGGGPAYALPAFGVPGRASGGPVLPGGTYLVGEAGPELLRMGSSAGSVSPVGMNVQIIIPGYSGDKQELALAVRDELIRMGRNTVGVGLG